MLKLCFSFIFRARFKHILQPIADICINEEQKEYIDFESFFTHTVCHECCHGIGPHAIILPSGQSSTVRRVRKLQLFTSRLIKIISHGFLLTKRYKKYCYCGSFFILYFRFTVLDLLCRFTRLAIYLCFLATFHLEIIPFDFNIYSIPLYYEKISFSYAFNLFLYNQELQEVHSALEEAKADIVGLWALKFLINQVFCFQSSIDLLVGC